jgi:hypothetical protein
MGTRTMTVSFNTDSAGFISQECPTCRRRFKIQPGKGSPNPVSHCPFCEHAATDCWFTPEQAEYLGAVATHNVLGPELDKLDRAFRRMGSDSGGVIRVTGRVEKPRVPPTPEESDDEMPVTATFACCGETIRHEPANRPTYCVICGKRAVADDFV